MGKKYVATVMDRYYVGEDSFIFKCNHVVVGEINPQTNLFKDRNGNEYAPMMSPGLMSSEIPYAYSNAIELSQIHDIIEKDIPLQAAISEYEYMCKKVIFFVGKTENGLPYVMPFNMDSIKETIQSVTEGKETNKIEHSKYQTNLDIDDNNKYQEKRDVQDLIIDIINGKYTLSELKEMLEHLKISQEDIEQLVETLELQIEASETGNSYTQIKGAEKPARSIFEDIKEDEDEVEEEPQFEEELIINNRSIDIEELFKKVTRTLIAQDEPARRVIAEIARKELDDRKKKEGILLTGPTGVGKTELMRLIAKYLNRPFYKVNSTQLTVPGYVGKDIEEVLWDLYVSCGRNLHDAENAIIFFDEIDKKGSSKKSDVSGQGVLNLLLPFIEGSTYDAVPDIKNPNQKIKIDTSNMIVILGGAYTDVYKNLVEKNGVGFNGKVSTKPTYRPATTKDFVEKGQMTDEFMGRVTVVRLNDLDYEGIKRVMLESDESALKIQEEIFKKLGVKLTFTDEYTTQIAKNAEQKKTGARGLNGVIDETTWVAFEDAYTHPGEYEEIKLTEETVKDPANYQLVKKKKSNE